MIRPCAYCPWRIENHGKHTPWGFYRQKNLRRLWNQIRRGGAPQGCHPTDPSHPDHVAAGAKPGAQPQECAGAVLLVLREFETIATISQGLSGTAVAPRRETDTFSPEQGRAITVDGIKHYLRTHRDGLTRAGLMYWLVSRYQFGGVPYIGRPRLPEVDLREPGIGRPTKGTS